MGDVIKANRKKIGMSQFELAEIMGVSQTAVSQWETDMVRPDIRKLMKLAEVLKIDVMEILREVKS